MSRYKAYSAYRDSQSKWLGAIPNHWNLFDGKRLLSSRRESAREGDEQLAASQKYGVVPQSLMMEMNDAKVMLALKGTSSFRHVGKNDFVISLRSFEGGIEHSSYVGCVSPAYTVLQAEKEVVPAYFKYLLKSGPYIAALQASTDSLRDGKSISYEQFGAIALPYPVVDEQVAIAAFLDNETAKIDALIEKQQRLIELLKEKRQAVISHAVTKGLNPNAPMKDSGVEWLGELPAHWQIKSLRYLGNCQNGINIGAEYFGSGYPFVSYGDVYRNDTLPIQVEGLVQSTHNDREIYSVRTGDILFTRTSETVDEIGFSAACLQTLENATFAGFLIRFRPNTTEVAVNFAKHYFRSTLMRSYFVQEMNLVTRASLSQDLLKRLPVPLPPENEQLEIAEYLDAKSRVFSKLTSNAETAIQLLKERRTALISAAVTGKIDVRDWQAAA
jgi:type I restriction enzyme S subunit